MNQNEKRIQTITLLAPLATELRELQDQNLIDVQNLRSTSASVISRCRAIGARVLLAEDRLNGAMALEDWLAANVANLPPDHAQRCKKLSKGGFSDPSQILLPFLAQAKQIEDKPKRLHPQEWELAWGYVTKLCKLDVSQWPQEQVAVTRDNLASTVERFGGHVVWE